MRTVLVRASAALTLAATGTLAACGDDDASGGASGAPRIVVTTNILGDVVQQLVGDHAEVEVVMPPNADPHDFAPSAQQAQAMREADVLVVNGGGFEESLADTIEAAEGDGVVVLAATDDVELLPFAAEEHGLSHDEGHEGEHGEEGLDPHVFTDPARMATIAGRLAERLAEEVEGLDTPAFRADAGRYRDELEALDAEVEALLAEVPAERRVLVTNHDVFGYFADRYGFEVLGTVVPAGSTLAEPSAADLDELADAIAEAAVPAIFADTSSPSRLADALAAEGADVEVVELFTESLGPEGSGGATYVEMVRTNAERIAGALSG